MIDRCPSSNPNLVSSWASWNLEVGFSASTGWLVCPVPPMLGNTTLPYSNDYRKILAGISYEVNFVQVMRSELTPDPCKVPISSQELTASQMETSKK